MLTVTVPPAYLLTASYVAGALTCVLIPARSEGERLSTITLKGEHSPPFGWLGFELDLFPSLLQHRA